MTKHISTSCDHLHKDDCIIAYNVLLRDLKEHQRKLVDADLPHRFHNFHQSMVLCSHKRGAALSLCTAVCVLIRG